MAAAEYRALRPFESHGRLGLTFAFMHERHVMTGIVQGGSFDASLENAIVASEFFDMALDVARQHANAMATIITRNWKQALRNEGATSDDVRIYTPAFERADTEKALKF